MNNLSIQQRLSEKWEPSCTDRFRMCRPTSEHVGIAFCMYPAPHEIMYRETFPPITFTSLKYDAPYCLPLPRSSY